MISLLMGAVHAQTGAPVWFLDKEREYPSSQYIAALGEGKTAAEAETAAVAGVSLFFSTKTEIRKEAIREFNETVVNGTADFSKKTYVNENAVIRSEEEFLGIRFARPWLDPQRQTWAALAYINRREAAEIYDAKISANMSVIDALMEDAGKETEALYACGLLYTGLRIAGITEEYIKTAAAVGSGQAGKYEAALGRIQQFRSAYRAGRDSLKFTVRVEGPDTAGRIERALQGLLEGSGYIITPQNPQYTVAARLSAAEETGRTRISIRAGITVRIERDGSALFSYTQNYEPVASRDRARAYSLAFIAIEQDLAENFITKLTAMLGR
jgi:hypothetical protein